MRHNGSTSTTDCIEWRRVTDLKQEHNESAIGVTVPNAYTRRSSLGSSQLRHACSVYVGVHICICISFNSALLIYLHMVPQSLHHHLPSTPLFYQPLFASLYTWKECDSERKKKKAVLSFVNCKARNKCVPEVCKGQKAAQTTNQQ